MIIFLDIVDVQLYLNDKERGNVNWTFHFIVSVSNHAELRCCLF